MTVCCNTKGQYSECEKKYGLNRVIFTIIYL